MSTGDSLQQAWQWLTPPAVEDGQGGVIHPELWLLGGYVMVVGPPRGDGAVSPATIGGRSTQSVHVQLQSGLDELCARARAAGAKIGARPAAHRRRTETDTAARWGGCLNTALKRDYSASSRMTLMRSDFPSNPMPGRSGMVIWPSSTRTPSGKPP